MSVVLLPPPSLPPPSTGEAVTSLTVPPPAVLPVLATLLPLLRGPTVVK